MPPLTGTGEPRLAPSTTNCTIPVAAEGVITPLNVSG